MRAFLAVALVLLVPFGAEARVIDREHSLYSNIVVTRDGSLICMQFTVRRDQRNQTCQDERDPQRMVFTYTRMMMAGLLLTDEPERILVVGLGGGTLPTALAELYPASTIDVVELDPAVVDVAREYFGFEESDNMRVIVSDARVFGKRAANDGRHYDLVLLDAFNGEYIPAHLMTREYLEETRSLLTDDGTLVANTFSISRLYDHESETYRAVFGPFFNLTSPMSANRIIVATTGALPTREELAERAAELAPRLEPYGVPITDYPPRMSTRPDWDTSARVLTDQYAPVNLLNEME